MGLGSAKRLRNVNRKVGFMEAKKGFGDQSAAHRHAAISWFYAMWSQCSCACTCAMSVLSLTKDVAWKAVIDAVSHHLVHLRCLKILSNTCTHIMCEANEGTITSELSLVSKLFVNCTHTCEANGGRITSLVSVHFEPQKAWPTPQKVYEPLIKWSDFVERPTLLGTRCTVPEELDSCSDNHDRIHPLWQLPPWRCICTCSSSPG